MAFHAIKAGEGDAFISAGWRPCRGSSRATPTPGPTPRTRCSTRPASADAAAGGATEGTTRAGDGQLSDVLIAARPPRTSPVHRDQPQDQGPLGRAQPEPRRGVRSRALLRARSPVTLLGRHRCYQHRRRPAPAPPTHEDQPAWLVFRPNDIGHRGGKRLLNDGAGCGGGPRPTPYQGTRLTSLARIVSTGCGLSPEIMGSGPIRGSERRWAARRCRSSTSTSTGSTRTFAVRYSARRALGMDGGQAQRLRRRDRPGPPVRDDRRPDHRHAAEQPADP